MYRYIIIDACLVTLVYVKLMTLWKQILLSVVGIDVTVV